LNPKGLLGSDYGPGTMLELIPRAAHSPDLVPERAKMLKGCEIYINGAPCPMCMSAIYWSRIDHLYFGASLEDTSHIGFSDEFQYQDFRLPWDQRKGIAVTPNFERETALAAYQAWEINRTITTTELNALCDGNRVPLDEREQNEGLSRRALLRVGLAGGSSTLFRCAPRSTAARQLHAGQAEPVALKTDFGFKGSALGASHPGFETAAFGNPFMLQPSNKSKNASSVA
jgi:Cytidine and deoxycytidylate deaminase zinc-binding region